MYFHSIVFKSQLGDNLIFDVYFKENSTFLPPINLAVPLSDYDITFLDNFVDFNQWEIFLISHKLIYFFKKLRLQIPEKLIILYKETRYLLEDDSDIFAQIKDEDILKNPIIK